MDYIPFDATGAEIAERSVLRPGVPATMRNALREWLAKRLTDQHDYGRFERFHELENNLDVEFKLTPAASGLIRGSDVRTLLDKLSDRDLLRAVDFTLYKDGKFTAGEKDVESVLAAGRSKYTVRLIDDAFRLAERVPEGVLSAAESVMDQETKAGQLLLRAWNAVYELQPDDSTAYSAAVKAVEAAALPALGITKDTATVSDAVRAIEKRGATWRLPFQREHSEYPSRDVLLGMLKSLYRGQRDRHGSAAYSSVTHEEAEAAVLMAVTLVGWFARDLVQERDIDAFG